MSSNDSARFAPRGGASLAQQALDAQAALLPYALMAFLLSMPVFVWAGSYADNAAWMTASFALFAMACGATYAAVNWLKTPSAADLRARGRVHILTGLVWAGCIGQAAAFADGAGPMREVLLMLATAAAVICIFFTSPWLPSLLVVGAAAAAGPLIALFASPNSQGAATLAWGGVALAFALALMLNRVLRRQFAMAIEREEIERLAKDRDDEQSILDRNVYARLKEMLFGKAATAGPKGYVVGTKLNDQMFEAQPRAKWWQFAVEDDKVMAEMEALHAQYEESRRTLEQRFIDKVDKLQRGDELPPGVMKMVKVFVATKRKLQPGDKMAGRHGNKGVVSRIVPREDMPYLEDGTPVDIVLNPLGVPSRRNVGQILETHLGWACAGVGKKINDLLKVYQSKGDLKPLKKEINSIFEGDNSITDLDDDSMVRLGEHLSKGISIATPVFDGAKDADIVEMLKRAGLDASGQSTVYDGRTGEAFDRKVTVGYIYMLKLHHLVDDKIHARSIGPYSLVTQQPLGGKAQFGGQRFGEMEVWALEAYGAAYTLQEMLTIKSDDVAGRTKVYEAIVRGDDTFEAGIPESFNVLVKEIRSLGLNVELDMADGTELAPGGPAADQLAHPQNAAE